MDKEEILKEENLELRISEMKSQFQQSYDVFIKAHEELSKITFDSLNLPSAAGVDRFGALSQLEPEDVNEIVDAGSIDDCLSALRSKVKPKLEEQPNTFPDVAKLLCIMNGLQSDIHLLTANQKHFSQLTDEVNNEMSLFEKRMEDSISQLGDLVTESSDESVLSQHDEEEDEETFGFESLSD